MKFSIPKGVFDILPQDPKLENIWRSSHLWQHIESLAREVAQRFSTKEIRTPIFERSELFQRSVGETSDIVSKEMYVFEDKGGRSMALRPEGTASVMRAFLDKKLYNLSQINKLFYIGPMFRYERQQAGRYRQHHQFGVEAIGDASPEQDVEILDMMTTFFKAIGLKDITLHINSVGDLESRQNYRKILQDNLRPHLSEMSEDSNVRFEKNPLRILDSKDPLDQKFISEIPSILDSLNDDCRKHFENVCKLLDDIGIKYNINPRLVRGLDYYTKTVFEFTTSELGSQNSIGGGGRYDGLIKSLGGPDLPAIGFGIGLERIIQTALAQGLEIAVKPTVSLFIIPMGDSAKIHAFKLLHKLRQSGLDCEMDFSGKKVKNAFRYADSIGAQNTIVIGDQEIESGVVTIKNMASREAKEISIAKIAEALC